MLSQRTGQVKLGRTPGEVRFAAVDDPPDPATAQEGGQGLEDFARGAAEGQSDVRRGLGAPADGAQDGRFEAAGSWNAMVTHRVRITSPEQIDTQVFTWLKQAYDAAA